MVEILNEYEFKWKYAHSSENGVHLCKKVEDGFILYLAALIMAVRNCTGLMLWMPACLHSDAGWNSVYTQQLILLNLLPKLPCSCELNHTFGWFIFKNEYGDFF